jgi:hypothetical protein
LKRRIILVACIRSTPTHPKKASSFRRCTSLTQTSSKRTSLILKRLSATFQMSDFLMTTRPLPGTLCGCSFTSCPGRIAAAVLRPAQDLQTTAESVSSGGEPRGDGASNREERRTLHCLPCSVSLGCVCVLRVRVLHPPRTSNHFLKNARSYYRNTVGTVTHWLACWLDRSHNIVLYTVYVQYE